MVGSKDAHLMVARQIKDKEKEGTNITALLSEA